MRYVRGKRRTVGNDTTSPRLNVSYVVYECPRCNLCRNPNGLVSFQKTRGYTNPINHLLSCYKQEEELFTEVRRHISTRNYAEVGSSLQDVFEETGSDRVKALYAYIQLIIFCNAPVSCVKISITASSRSSMQNSAESTLLKYYMN